MHTLTRPVRTRETVRLQTCLEIKISNLHVDEIVQDDQVAGFDFFFQGTGRRGRNNVRTSQGFQGPDVGPIINVGRTYRVLAPVSGNKNVCLRSRFSRVRPRPVDRRRAYLRFC